MSTDYVKQIDQAINAIGAYDHRLITIVQNYDESVEQSVKDARQYREDLAAEKIRISTEEARRKAKSQINNAREVCTAELYSVYSQLKADVKVWMVAVPKNDFLEVIRPYFEFNIAPTRLEAERLIELAPKNLLALRTVNTLLERTESPYRVVLPDIKQIEDDLSTLERLSVNTDWIPEGIDSHKYLGILGLGEDNKADLAVFLSNKTSFISDVFELPEIVGRCLELDAFTPTIYDTNNHPSYGKELGAKKADAIKNAKSNLASFKQE